MSTYTQQSLDPQMRRPQQSRSEETLRRFLVAAEELLEEGSFGETPIVEIARRADRSVGAFYARFDSKEALFTELCRRAVRSLAESLNESLSPSGWQRWSLAERARHLIASVADVYSKHRGVLRSMSLRARLRSEPTLEEEAPQINEGLYQRAERLLEDCLGHLQPDVRAVKLRMGILVVASTLREHILFDQIGLSPVPVDRERLVEELTLVLCSYLRSSDAAEQPASHNPRTPEKTS